MPKVTLGITGLPENLGRDYGIEKPYWGPSFYIGRKTYGYYSQKRSKPK